MTVTRSFDPEGGYILTRPNGSQIHAFTMQWLANYIERNFPREPVQWNIHEED